MFDRQIKFLLHSIVQLIVVVVVVAAQQEERIFGGTSATIDQEPYVVQLFRDGSFKCGGAIIAPTWVATAAHCIYGYGRQPERFQVRAGSTTISGTDGVAVRVAMVARNSRYSPTTVNNDIALLKLIAPLPLNERRTTMGAIPLCSAAVPLGADVKIMGWGSTEQNSVSDTLLKSNLKTIPREVCQQQYLQLRDPIQITNTMLCAFGLGKDACKGDSGGPLVYNGELCGIVSFGAGCAQPNFAGVYADVWQLRRFIGAVMRKYGR